MNAPLRRPSPEPGALPDRALLLRIANGFFGYGRLDAPLWLVGYEEPCEDERDAARRLPALATFEGAEDVLDAHRRMGHPDPSSRGTWPEMQRIAEAAGLGRGQVGGRTGNVFLAELLPFPHATAGSWYRELYGALGYRSRAEYVSAVLPRRVERLRAEVLRHRPAVVLVHHRLQDRTLAGRLMGGAPEARDLGRKTLLLRQDAATRWLACPSLGPAAFWSAPERAGLREAVRQALAGGAGEGAAMHARPAAPAPRGDSVPGATGP